jgi:hypothetical protein
VVPDHITVRAVFHRRHGPYRGAGTGREGGRIPPDKKPVGTVPGCQVLSVEVWVHALLTLEARGDVPGGVGGRRGRVAGGIL